jgi:hypothetical protein
MRASIFWITTGSSFDEEDGRQAIVVFAYDASKTIGAIIDGAENAAKTALKGIGGVFVDVGNGLADGAGRLWDWAF